MKLITQLNQISLRIAIIGIGGAGTNAINNMMAYGLQGVEFIVANTNLSELEKSEAQTKIQLGVEALKGLGAGGDPEAGRKAAEESLPEIEAALKGIKILFISAGMGGGTGTGAAPVIGRKAKDMDILTIGIVSLPFDFEGTQRKAFAQKGIIELEDTVDTLIVFPNNKISKIFKLPFLEAYKKTDEIITNAAQSISQIFISPGYMSVDFADLRAIMKDAGYALIGTGIADGEERAKDATELAINNPLLSDIDIKSARSLIVIITAGNSESVFLMDEFEKINHILASENENVHSMKVGVYFDDTLLSKLKVTIIATGLAPSEAIKNLASEQTQRGESASSMQIATPYIVSANEPSDLNFDKNDILDGMIKSTYNHSSSPQKSFAAPTDYRRNVDS